MKYEGLKKLETTVTELSTVVYSCRGDNEGDISAQPQAVEVAAEPQIENPAAKKVDGKPKKKRRLIFALLKQTAICALVVGGLLLLKYIDSGFSAEVFKGVKDIISYSYEIPGVAS